MSAPPSLRELRQRRERADDWIGYASWAAIGAAALGFLLVLGIALDDFGGIPQALPILSTLAGQAATGYKLRQRSQWAAWGLMAMYAASFALSALAQGILSGLLLKLAIGFVYVKGFLVTLDYEELTQQIAAATPASSPSGDAA
jgi:hypothetical protein